MKKLLIKNGTVLLLKEGVLEAVECDILVQNDKIVKIGLVKDLLADETIDATGMIVMPGLVDTHRHLWESAFKGMASNWSLMEYLNGVLGGIAPHFTPEDVYTGNLLGALEAINSGVTSVFDWSHIMNSMEHTEAAIQALRDSGIRAKFGYGTPGTAVWEWFYESKLKHPQEAKDIRRMLLPSDDELVTMGLAIRGPEYSSMEVSKHDILMGRELGLQVSMHIGGGIFGPKYNGIQKLYEAGLLQADLNFAHANTLSENDLKVLADHNCSISITPEVELQMGLGLPVTGKALQNKISCGLGVDVVTATSGNLFNQMKIALQAERALQNNLLYRKGNMPEKLTLSEADILKMATSTGAETIGLFNRTGSLEAGKQADIILIDSGNISLAPSLDPISSVVQYANESHVDTVIIAGKVQKRKGKLVHPNLQDLLDKAKESSSRILNHAAI
jgi:cytosine/adenosine deaminase-related metal-dependent hydrolase